MWCLTLWHTAAVSACSWYCGQKRFAQSCSSGIWYVYLLFEVLKVWYRTCLHKFNIHSATLRFSVLVLDGCRLGWIALNRIFVIVFGTSHQHLSSQSPEFGCEVEPQRDVYEWTFPRDALLQRSKLDPTPSTFWLAIPFAIEIESQYRRCILDWILQERTLNMRIGSLYVLEIFVHSFYSNS